MLGALKNMFLTALPEQIMKWNCPMWDKERASLSRPSLLGPQQPGRVEREGDILRRAWVTHRKCDSCRGSKMGHLAAYPPHHPRIKASRLPGKGWLDLPFRWACSA